MFGVSALHLDVCLGHGCLPGIQMSAWELGVCLGSLVSACVVERLPGEPGFLPEAVCLPMEFAFAWGGGCLYGNSVVAS